jgi:hypothetical protein
VQSVYTVDVVCYCLIFSVKHLLEFYRSVQKSLNGITRVTCVVTAVCFETTDEIWE